MGEYNFDEPDIESDDWTDPEEPWHDTDGEPIPEEPQPEPEVDKN